VFVAVATEYYRAVALLRKQDSLDLISRLLYIVACAREKRNI